MIRRLHKAGVGWAEDQAAQMGAALAYYTLFSLTPLLVLALAVVSMVFGESESQAQLLGQLKGYIDDKSAEAIVMMLEQFQAAGRGKLTASIIGLVSLLFGATGMFTSLRS